MEDSAGPQTVLGSFSCIGQKRVVMYIITSCIRRGEKSDLARTINRIIFLIPTQVFRSNRHSSDPDHGCYAIRYTVRADHDVAVPYPLASVQATTTICLIRQKDTVCRLNSFIIIY